MSPSPTRLASTPRLVDFTAELRDDADEAMALLNQFADVSHTPDMFSIEARLMQIAGTFQRSGWTRECDAITAAYNALHNYVSIRCRHARDADSAFSPTNYYPPENPIRRRYEVRVAQEKRDLEGFPTARTAILAKAGLVLSGTVLDATLERLRTEPLTAEAVASAVPLAASYAPASTPVREMEHSL
jgi:hypothetical protein